MVPGAHYDKDYLVQRHWRTAPPIHPNITPSHARVQRAKRALRAVQELPHLLVPLGTRLVGSLGLDLVYGEEISHVDLACREFSFINLMDKQGRVIGI